MLSKANYNASEIVNGTKINIHMWDKKARVKREKTGPSTEEIMAVNHMLQTQAIYSARNILYSQDLSSVLPASKHHSSKKLPVWIAIRNFMPGTSWKAHWRWVFSSSVGSMRGKLNRRAPAYQALGTPALQIKKTIINIKWQFSPRDFSKLPQIILLVESMQ